MPSRDKKKTFAEKFYKANVLPDGNRRSVEQLDMVIQKLENPPVDDDQEKGSL